MLPIIDIEDLGLDAGAHLLVKHGLAGVPPGGAIEVVGSCPGWEAQLSAWCRGQGHRCDVNERDGRSVAQVTR
ncbi:MAG: ferritin-like domain-containing protein, partial [Burkholderiaceae bacterium]|nr:ferritin-like domain-containing protein [Burkholderiaceae bacterium]